MKKTVLNSIKLLAPLIILQGCNSGETGTASDIETKPITNETVIDSRPNILLIITDDQSYPHASAYGSKLVKTPAFDRIADEGFLFERAFVSAPSCGPSRASLLTGKPFYTLGVASMNHTAWDNTLVPVTDTLTAAGYAVGYTGKGWAPGNWEASGRKLPPTGKAYNDIHMESPAGKHFAPWDYAANFEAFLDEADEEPFFFWTGIFEPHRPFDEGIGEENGLTTSANDIPEFLPDASPVRQDMADYAYEIEYADKHVERMLKELEDRGELENTLIIVTSDNGMAFPRAKATVYDSGTRVPTSIRWPDAEKTGVKITELVSLLDFAPTLLEAANIEIPESMVGISLLPLMESEDPASVDLGRDSLVFGVERHFPGARPNGAGYPIRALRTDDYLYIRNYTPDADTMGNNPGPIWPKDDPVGGFGDIDGGLSKTYLWENRDQNKKLAEMSFGQRPAEELYDVNKDPDQFYNLAGDENYLEIKAQLAAEMDVRLSETGDPRATGNSEAFEKIMQDYPVEGVIPKGLKIE